MAELAAPLLDDMETAVAAAQRSDPAQRRWQTIEGLLEVYLRHRRVLSLVVSNLAVFAREPVFQRYFATMSSAIDLVAGPDPDLAERVRGTQAIAILRDPVILLTDAPTDPLRQAILCGARRLLIEVTPDGSVVPGAPPDRPRGRGRPGVMGPDMVAAARAMHNSGSRTMAEIATALGVSRATVYRYLSPD